MITVAIVDDNRLVREALAAILRPLDDLRVFATGVADPSFIQETQADVLLLDVGLGDEDSLGVAAAIVKQRPATKIIVMDLVPMHEDVVQFVNAGVSGFVLKDATFEEFVETIRAVAAGGKVLPPRMAESLFAQIA